MRVELTALTEDGTVDERTDAAFAIHQAIAEDIEATNDSAKATLYRSLGIGIIGIIAGIVVGTQIGPWMGFLVALAGVGAAGVGTVIAKDTSPDISVKGATKWYWTFEQFPHQDGTVLYDRDDLVSRSEFELEQFDNTAVFSDVHETLRDADELPVVASSSADPETAFLEQLRQVSREIEDADQINVSAPMITADDTIAKSIDDLREFTTDDDPSVTTEIDPGDAADEIELMETLEKMAFEDDADEQLREMSEAASERANQLQSSQERAIEALDSHLETAENGLARATYNFYCPVCQADDIESKLTVHTSADGVDLRCSTCLNSFDPRDEAVIPRHRIRDELVLDIVDQLWIEKDDERRRIYENIEDQQSDLEEREYEQRREEIRTTWDRIKDLRSRIRDLTTEARAAEGRVEEIGELMAEYDRLQQERLDSFEQDVQETVQRIDEETEEVLEQTKNLQQERLDEARNAAKEKAKIINEEQRQRNREQLAVAKDTQQAVEENTEAVVQSSAELQRTLEEHHDKQMQLETKGNIARTGLVKNIRKMKRGSPLVKTTSEGRG